MPVPRSAVFLAGDRDAAAIKVCQACGPRYECLAIALDYDAPGVWGGMTDDDRAPLRRPERDDRKCPMVVAHPAGWRGGEVPEPAPAPASELEWPERRWIAGRPVLAPERRRILAANLNLNRPFRLGVAEQVAEAFGVRLSTVVHDVKVLRKRTRG